MWLPFWSSFGLSCGLIFCNNTSFWAFTVIDDIIKEPLVRKETRQQLIVIQIALLTWMKSDAFVFNIKKAGVSVIALIVFLRWVGPSKFFGAQNHCILLMDCLVHQLCHTFIV